MTQTYIFNFKQSSFSSKNCLFEFASAQNEWNVDSLTFCLQ